LSQWLKNLQRPGNSGFPQILRLCSCSLTIYIYLYNLCSALSLPSTKSRRTSERLDGTQINHVRLRRVSSSDQLCKVAGDVVCGRLLKVYKHISGLSAVLCLFCASVCLHMYEINHTQSLTSTLTCVTNSFKGQFNKIFG
jgi:hypothetical protein